MQTRTQTLTQLQTKVAQGTQFAVYVINKTPDVSRAPLMFSVISQGIEVSVVVENTWLPSNLAEKVAIKDLVANPNFMAACGKNLISIIEPEDAECILKSQRGTKEANRLQANAIKPGVTDTLPDIIEKTDVLNSTSSKAPEGVSESIFAQVVAVNEDSLGTTVGNLLGMAGIDGSRLSKSEVAYIEAIGAKKGFPELENFMENFKEEESSEEVESSEVVVEVKKKKKKVKVKDGESKKSKKSKSSKNSDGSKKSKKSKSKKSSR